MGEDIYIKNYKDVAYKAADVTRFEALRGICLKELRKILKPFSH